ncbi:hypothetical protein GCM10027299_09300 [Larkinella ripae]
MKSYKLPIIHNGVACEVAVTLDDRQAMIFAYVEGEVIDKPLTTDINAFEGSVLTAIKSVRNYVERHHPVGPKLTEPEKTLLRLGFVEVEKPID